MWLTFPVVESSKPIENPGPPWIKCLWYDHGIELVGLLANTLSRDSVGEMEKLGEDCDPTGDCKAFGGFAVSGTARDPRIFICTVCAPQLILSSLVMETEVWLLYNHCIKERGHSYAT